MIRPYKPSKLRPIRPFQKLISFVKAISVGTLQRQDYVHHVTRLFVVVDQVKEDNGLNDNVEYDLHESNVIILANKPRYRGAYSTEGYSNHFTLLFPMGNIVLERQHLEPRKDTSGLWVSPKRPGRSYTICSIVTTPVRARR